MTRRLCTNRWFLPGFSVLMGVMMLAAFWVGGNPGQGWISLGVMAALALALAAGGRSETIRMIRGDGRDERWARIDLTATALAGFVLIVAVIAGAVWEWAHGRDGSPYAQLCAIGGVAYAVAVAVLRVRG